MDKISVIGLGKLGGEIAGFFRDKNIPPLTYDTNKTGNATYEEIVNYTNMTFVVVPTPSRWDGRYDVSRINDVLESLKPYLAKKTTPHGVVIISTTNVGDCRRFYDAYFSDSPHRLIYSPEFIRMGEVRRDLENPHLILVADKDGTGSQELITLYMQVISTTPPVHYLQYEEAELAKIGINSFLTMKISFSNTIQAIGRGIRLPVDSVLEAIGDDPRIGHKYLAPGLGYGGPCLPRDNKNLERLVDVIQDIPLTPKRTLMHATDLTNEMTWTGWAREVYSRTKSSETVGFLGITYKPHTSLLDESQAYKIYNYVKDSRKTEIYDPNLAERSTVAGPEALIEASDLVFVGTPDDRWRGLFYKHPEMDFIDPWYVITE